MGKLILVNSGIGNLDDLSIKVRRCLMEGRYFVVEDSRKFKDLLRRLDIPLEDKVVESWHEHSMQQKLHKILSRPGDVHVLSDRGSPVISDPAFPLVREALERGREVDSASGVCSILYALELSGLPPHPASFWGFLSRTAKGREELWGGLGQGTHLFFESPHRLRQSMGEFTGLFPDARFVLAKELSKTYQQVERFRGQEWPRVEQNLDIRGEFVLLVHLERSTAIDEELRSIALDILQTGNKT